MRKRDLRLEEYQISKYAYRELNNLCLQYPEVRHKADAAIGLHAGFPLGRGQHNPTQDYGIILAVCKEECALIENTAKEAAGSMWRYLMQNITLGMRYEDIAVPCGRRQFYELRRYFFFLLAKKKGKI